MRGTPKWWTTSASENQVIANAQGRTIAACGSGRQQPKAGCALPSAGSFTD
jgi:hypothetical protein